MRSALSSVLAGTMLFFAPAFAQQQPNQTNPPSQNNSDVPHQQPGTNNPDVSKQRTPAPQPETNPTQGEADVPHQKPGTSNPDVNKQRQPAPKKAKKHKSTSATDSSSQS